MATITSNPAWADALQKILKTNKSKRKKRTVLSKAKKHNAIAKKEESLSFKGDEIEERKETKILKTPSSKRNVILIKRKQRKKDNLGIRVKPSITDKEREKLLQKIATKGVVQLFNAVKQQQVDTNKKLSDAGPLERKREQVLKNIDRRAFLDVLMGESKSISVNDSIEHKEKNKNDKGNENKVWSVLRDDFVMGAKLKDWDKKQISDEDSSALEDIDSD